MTIRVGDKVLCVEKSNPNDCGVLCVQEVTVFSIQEQCDYTGTGTSPAGYLIGVEYADRSYTYVSESDLFDTKYREYFKSMEDFLKTQFLRIKSE